MQGISKTKRNIFIFFTIICVLGVALGVTFLLEDSMLRVKSKNGDDLEYFIPFYERNSTTFEDSSIFEDLLTDDIKELTRYCVIKNQLETNGEYDPKKKVNIVKYANRYESFVNSDICVEYYLDDLINWGNRGIEEQKVDAYGLPFDTDKESVNIVVPRYRTVDGKDLSFYASNLEEYNMLYEDLLVATNNLSSNYKEYVEFNKKYKGEATNINYCFQLSYDGEVSRFSNVEDINADMSIDDITTLFKDNKKYLYFNVDKLTCNTNTNISPLTMNKIISSYDYSFNDNSRIWIGFEGTYDVNDAFSYGKEYYDERSVTNTYGLIFVCSVVLFALFYLVLIVYLTKKEGYVLEKDERGETKTLLKLKKADSIPTEVYFIFAIIMMMAFVGVIYCMYYGMIKIAWGTIFVYPIALVGAVILNICFLTTYLAFVRRVKAKSLWKNSCLCYVITKIRDTSVEAYDNGHAIVRTWIPYVIFLLLNLVFVLCGLAGILFAFIVDMVVGAFLYKGNKERQIIIKDINEISNGNVKHQVDLSGLHGDNLELGQAVNNIGNGIRKAVETSMKDEKMKADLITNVSHDIKTPLTSIISYVDLLKREDINDDKIKSYINVLDQKSQRLKQLTDDLVEASKISSGNIVLKYEAINIAELIKQSIAEFADKFEEHSLTCMLNLPEEKVYVNADSRSMFRIIENLYNNIYKYALYGTRVYINMEKIEEYGKERVRLSVKNISDKMLNISPEELLERFKQGDESRKTEGSGLGLSIAKSLTETMGGNFDISLDGDLFKIIISFDIITA